MLGQSALCSSSPRLETLPNGLSSISAVAALTCERGQFSTEQLTIGGKVVYRETDR